MGVFGRTWATVSITRESPAEFRDVRILVGKEAKSVPGLGVAAFTDGGQDLHVFDGTEEFQINAPGLGFAGVPDSVSVARLEALAIRLVPATSAFAERTRLRVEADAACMSVLPKKSFARPKTMAQLHAYTGRVVSIYATLIRRLERVRALGSTRTTWNAFLPSLHQAMTEIGKIHDASSPPADTQAVTASSARLGAIAAQESELGTALRIPVCLGVG